MYLATFSISSKFCKMASTMSHSLLYFISTKLIFSLFLIKLSEPSQASKYFVLIFNNLFDFRFLIDISIVSFSSLKLIISCPRKISVHLLPSKFFINMLSNSG